MFFSLFKQNNRKSSIRICRAFVAECSRLLEQCGQKKEKPDGFTVIEPLVRQCIRALPTRLILPLDGAEEVRLLSVMRKACTPLGAPDADALLAQQSGEMTEAEARVFFSFLVLFAFLQYTDRDATDASREEYMRFLFAMRYMRPEEIYCALSPVEHWLRKDPSGNYLRADESTRRLYRSAVCERAARRKEDPGAAAKRLIEQCTAARQDPAFVLFAHDSARYRRWYGAVYWSQFVFHFGLLSLLCLKTHTLLPYFSLLFFPEIISGATRRFASRQFGNRALPRYAFATIPDDCKTLCVTAVLLLNQEENDRILARLEDNYLRNRDPGCRFGLIADLPESDMPQPQDALCVMLLRDKLRALSEKYHTDFYFFFRKAVYNTKEKRYMGWERKRGALLQLCQYLAKPDVVQEGLELLWGSSDFLRQTKYLVTLDADTVVGYGEIRRLAATAAFPTNRPVIDRERKCVVSGFGVIQPNIDVLLDAQMATPFSKVMSGFGGSRVYQSAGYHHYVMKTGCGIFCGKGLLDIHAAAALLPQAFPENRVLSHDFIEGCILSCGFAGDIDFLDGEPANVISYQNRLNRWIRGDVQALPFVFGSRRREMKRILRQNIYAYFIPLFSLVGLFLFASRMPFFFWLPLTVLLSESTHMLWDVLCSPCRFRKLYGDVFHPIARIVTKFILDVATLPYSACSALISVFLGFFRSVISHRHCLQWSTASEGERLFAKKSLLFYYEKMLICVLAGIAMCLIGKPGAVLLGALFLFAPFIEYRYGSQSAGEDAPALSAAQRQMLLHTAHRTWDYYERLVDIPHLWLPPDNLQLQPVRRVAMITSPTNVGMYLIGCVAALELQFISGEMFCRRISGAVDALIHSKKWCGHLYNWFDACTRKELGTPYISLVDSGNLLASLYVLLGALKHFSLMEDVQAQIQVLIDQTDLKAFYRPGNRLMAIGYFPKTGKFTENEFDLYMSEARTASFLAVARGEVGVEHWNALSRALIEQDRHIGMLSWTGTAFEYFMPSLWFGTRTGSYLHEALSFARERQIADGERGGLWGNSESAYYGFDERGNYQYRAFGAPSLALAAEQANGRVFAPYATFLMSQMAGKTGAILENLKKFQQIGGYGKLGYYDAVDVNARGRYRVVKNHMSHHQGMILGAVCNILRGGLLEDFFFSDPQMRAAKLLLEEKIPFYEKDWRAER